MAVQAHYLFQQHPRESPFLARGGGGAPEGGRTAAMEMAQVVQKEAVAPHQHPAPVFLDFAHAGDCNGGGRKRQREAEAVSMSPQLFSLHPQAQVMGGGLEQLRKRPAMGLRLDFDEASEQVPSTSAASASCLLSDEVAAQRDQCNSEMDRLIQEHAERLRRSLADMRRRHYRSLLGAAEAAASRRLREKEAEVSEAARRGAELEERVARLRAEASAWQAKALADQSTAAALHAQLQHAQAQARCKAEEQDAGAADDAGSCFVDPDRVVEVPAPPGGRRRDAALPPPLRLRRVRARRVGECPRRRRLPDVLRRGHWHCASVLLLARSRKGKMKKKGEKKCGVLKKLLL